MSTGCYTETCDLGQPTSNKSGFGVFAVVHAIVEACTDSDDVFEGTRQLYANHIVRRVDTVVGCCEQGTNVYSYIGFIRGNNGSSRFSLSNFASYIGATE